LRALKVLASETGGTYIETTSISELKKIYSQLGSSLASEYLLRYKSVAGPDKQMTVTVSVNGVRVGVPVGYRTPKLNIPAKRAARAPYKPSAFVRFWTSSVTMTVVGLVAAGLIGLGTLMLLSGPKKGTVRRRMAEFVSVPTAIRDASRRPARQRRLFAEQLPDNLQVLASALRAGHSFIGALSVVVNDAPEPAKSEFQRVVADEQLGVPIDEALHVVVERMASRELEQVALVG